MIDILSGRVVHVQDKKITLMVGDIGFSVLAPHARQLVIDEKVSLFAYFHWSAENGPSLYGFPTQLTRNVFLLIIDCPKIGPALALNILSQMNVGQFLQAITTQKESALSALTGVGPKKAEQLIVDLKHKVQKLIDQGGDEIFMQANFVQWQQLSDVLTSLNYSKQEIGRTVTHLTAKYQGQECQLDQLIRAALAFLSTPHAS